MVNVVMNRGGLIDWNKEDDSMVPPKPTANDLSLHNQGIHHILSHNFLHWVGHRDDISPTDLFFLYCLIKGIRINLPFPILHNMVEAKNLNNVGNLLYGMVLTKIFNYFKVPKDILEIKYKSYSDYKKQCSNLWDISLKEEYGFLNRFFKLTCLL